MIIQEAHEAPKEGSEVAGAPGTNQNLETEEDNRTQFSTEQDDEFISDSHQVVCVILMTILCNCIVSLISEKLCFILT